MGGWIGRVAVRRIRKKGIDLSRVAFIPDPRRCRCCERHRSDPAIAELRTPGPAVPSPDAVRRLSGLAPDGHQESRVVLTDRGSYSNDIRHLFDGDGPATSDDIGGLGFTDPPLHTRLRKIVTPEFTMRRLARLIPIIEDIVDTQLDEMEALGHRSTWPSSWPSRCRSRRSARSRPRLRRPGRVREARQRQVRRCPGGAAAFGAVSAQREFLFDAVARQRLEPGPGLIGQIIREQGDEISDVDLAGLPTGSSPAASRPRQA